MSVMAIGMRHDTLLTVDIGFSAGFWGVFLFGKGWVGFGRDCIRYHYSVTFHCV